MKLRLRENSIRLRLLQSEVKKLQETGHYSETITLGLSPDQQFVYAIRILKDYKEVSAQIKNNHFEILLPDNTAKDWIENDDVVGIYQTQNIDDVLDLKITIEKDFACPTRPMDKDNLDAFPNPELSC